jgi:hypothetical protein
MNQKEDIKIINKNESSLINSKDYSKDSHQEKSNEIKDKKRLIKQRLHIDYQQMYEETIKSGDLESVQIMKKMIRKLSSRIIGDDKIKNIFESNSFDDIGDTNELFVINNDSDFVYINNIVDNIEVDFLEDKLHNFDQFDEINYCDFDTSKLNKSSKSNSEKIKEYSDCVDKECHQQKFKEIKLQKKITKEKFKNSKLYRTYKKLYNDIIIEGDEKDAFVLEKMIHKLFE